MEKTQIFKKKIGKARIYYNLMILPAVIFVFLFNTRTWPGLLIAFEQFYPTKGWFGSEWVGLKNFMIYFKQPDAWRIMRNTIVIAIGKIVAGQVIAIVFALLLNEVRSSKLKKGIQTATYFPHFISWVIYAGILRNILSKSGAFGLLINNFLALLGTEPIDIFTTPSIFPWLLILTECMKNFGYGAIVYLAAITAIDQGLYEAAKIDGASRWKQTIHVTLPGISYMIVLQAVLSLGSVLNAGFDQVFNMYSRAVMSTGDIIDTWVYRQGLVNLNYGVGTAVGLFKSVIGLVLTIIAYWMADKFADYRIF